jgi:hypothetical protein
MSLPDIMLTSSPLLGEIVDDGEEVVPAWLITTPEGSYLILTRFGHNKEGQRERPLFLIELDGALSAALGCLLLPWLKKKRRPRGAPFGLVETLVSFSPSSRAHLSRLSPHSPSRRRKPSFAFPRLALIVSSIRHRLVRDRDAAIGRDVYVGMLPAMRLGVLGQVLLEARPLALANAHPSVYI